MSLTIIFPNIEFLLQIALLDTWMILMEGIGIPRHSMAVLIKEVDWDWVERTPSRCQPPRSCICNANSNTVALWPLIGQPLGGGKGGLAPLIFAGKITQKS